MAGNGLGLITFLIPQGAPMTTYKRFEDLPVWQASAKLAAQLFKWSTHRSFRGKGDLANQIQRATLSVSNNIAEGFERGSTNDLLKFIYIARGSAGEVRSMLCVMEMMEEFGELKLEIVEFKKEIEGVSRQLRGWANSLQNSEIKGQRHLDEQSRRQFDRKQRLSGFQEKMDGFRRAHEEKVKKYGVTLKPKDGGNVDGEICADE